ncbi:hypothetical protein OQA88_9311 [Cercophora sp. LCS_1]
MLDFLYVRDAIIRNDGAIKLPPEAPTEVPPWEAPPDPDDKEPPWQLNRLTLNPRDPRKRRPKQANATSPAPGPVNTGTVTYERLRSDPNDAEIRLLRLLPGKGAEPLRCELAHVPLASAGGYDALSYCWGPSFPRAEVTCDGVSVSVTVNLAKALRAFRLPTSPRNLWVDALCIDQESADEKQHQVPLMGRIYHGASAVRIWLGNDTPIQPLTDALDILRHVYRLCVKFGWHLEFGHILSADPKLPKEYGLPAYADDSWRSIKYLLEMPWFSRTWVIQEVVLSREAYLHSNNTSLPWIEFCVGLISLNRQFFIMRPDIIPSLAACSHVMELILTYHKAKSATTRSGLHLLALLENHHLAQASDARDKIYAFLGIHDELAGKTAHGIVADYHSSARDVYLDTAVRLIQYTNNLDVLNVAGRKDDGVPNLPSWVPDWSTSDLVSPLTYKTLDGTYLYNFHAAGTICDGTCPATFNGNQLRLSGFCFDKVIKVGDVADLLLRNEGSELSIMAIAPQTVALLLSWFRTSGALEHGEEKYPDGQSNVEAFIRTIFLNDVPDDIIFAEFPGFRRVFRAPFQALKQRWSGENDMPSFYGILASCILLRLLGCGGLQRFARALRKVDDGFPLTFTAYMQYQPIDAQKERQDIDPDAGYRTFFVRLRSLYRRLFVTERGYMGLGPREMQVGDSAFLVHGSRTPLVFRPRDFGHWELVGDCYVHGIMQGEAFVESKCEQFVVV